MKGYLCISGFLDGICFVGVWKLDELDCCLKLFVYGFFVYIVRKYIIEGVCIVLEWWSIVKFDIGDECNGVFLGNVNGLFGSRGIVGWIDVFVVVGVIDYKWVLVGIVLVWCFVDIDFKFVVGWSGMVEEVYDVYIVGNFICDGCYYGWV